MNKKKSVFRIFFSSQGKGYEIYARKVNQSDIYGFVEIEEIVFGEKSAIVLDPNEEAFRRMQGQSVPYVVLLKPDGEAQYVKVGYRPGDEKTLEAEIVKLLGEPEGEASEEGNTEEGES